MGIKYIWSISDNSRERHISSVKVQSHRRQTVIYVEFEVIPAPRECKKLDE